MAMVAVAVAVVRGLVVLGRGVEGGGDGRKGCVGAAVGRVCGRGEVVVQVLMVLGWRRARIVMEEGGERWFPFPLPFPVLLARVMARGIANGIAKHGYGERIRRERGRGNRVCVWCLCLSLSLCLSFGQKRVGDADGRSVSLERAWSRSSVQGEWQRWMGRAAWRWEMGNGGGGRRRGWGSRVRGGGG